MLASPFHAAAGDFAAEVRAAVAAFEKEPGNTAPLQSLNDKMQERRKRLAQDILAKMPDSTAWSGITAIFALMETSLQEIEAAPPLEAAVKTVPFVKKVEAESKDIRDRLAAGHDDIIALGKENNTLKDDFDILNDAVQKLAGNGGSSGDMLALARNTARTAADLTTQGIRIGLLLQSSSQHMALLDAWVSDMPKMKDKFSALAQDAEKTIDMIDSCSTGTRRPLAVRSKPLSLRAA